MDGAEARVGSGCNRRAQVRRLGERHFTAAKRAAFMDALAATCNVKAAAQSAGISTGGVYKARRNDPGFAAQWDEALATGYDRLEAEALRYALERFGGTPIDPDAATGGTVADSAAGRLSGGAPSDNDLRFVLWLLGRHREAAGGRRRAPRLPPVTTEQTDAKLAKLLAIVERRLPK